MILQIQVGADNTNIVRKYIKDRSEINNVSGNIIKLFDDDGNEIPLYVPKVKVVIEETEEENKSELENFLSQGD